MVNPVSTTGNGFELKLIGNSKNVLQCDATMFYDEKLSILPAKVLVSSHIRPSKTLTFFNSKTQ